MLTKSEVRELCTAEVRALQLAGVEVEEGVDEMLETMDEPRAAAADDDSSGWDLARVLADKLREQGVTLQQLRDAKLVAVNI